MSDIFFLYMSKEGCAIKIYKTIIFNLQFLSHFFYITRPLQWYDLPPGSKNVLFKVSFTSQTSRSNNKLDIGTFKLGHPRLTNSKTNNKRDIGTFKFGHHCLTLNEGPKVKSDHIKRFPAHVFL